MKIKDFLLKIKKGLKEIAKLVKDCVIKLKSK